MAVWEGRVVRVPCCLSPGLGAPSGLWALAAVPGPSGVLEEQGCGQ